MQGLHFPFVLFNKRNSPAASSDTLKDVCIVVLKTQLDSTLSDAAFPADSPGAAAGPARPGRRDSPSAGRGCLPLQSPSTPRHNNKSEGAVNYTCSALMSLNCFAEIN